MALGDRVDSVFAVCRHFDKLVRLHALNAEVPVALGTPPAFEPFRLIEASQS